MSEAVAVDDTEVESEAAVESSDGAIKKRKR